MKVLHVIKSVAPQSGGPAAVVLNLAARQAMMGLKVSIATENNDPAEASWGFWAQRIRGAEHLVPINLRSVRRSDLWSGKGTRLLHASHDIVHAHGVWDAAVWSCLGAGPREKARLILAPHGMLSVWGMNQKKLKKRVIWDVLLRSRLQQVTCMHALNEAERKELHGFLPEVPARVLPNGIDPVEFGGAPRMPSPRLTGSCARFVLSLARLHVMKGPDRLLDAFAAAVRTDARMADVGLVLAGPDFGMADKLKRRATDLGIAHRVSFPGSVFGEEKHALLAGAACLCQPSRHEGFSVTLLEALAVGTPAIATPEANFPELAIKGCGLIVDGDGPELARAVADVVGSKTLREQMATAGRRLVNERYTWEKIAADSVRFYAEVLEAPRRQVVAL